MEFYAWKPLLAIPAPQCEPGGPTQDRHELPRYYQPLLDSGEINTRAQSARHPDVSHRQERFGGRSINSHRKDQHHTGRVEAKSEFGQPTECRRQLGDYRMQEHQPSVREQRRNPSATTCNHRISSIDLHSIAERQVAVTHQVTLARIKPQPQSFDDKRGVNAGRRQWDGDLRSIGVQRFRLVDGAEERHLVSDGYFECEPHRLALKSAHGDYHDRPLISNLLNKTGSGCLRKGSV